ncbi:acetyl-CoA carboxylase biotin carboxylase subunit family protein [Streptomyces sp. NPDC006530]|uniref:ATP-grasp domain-containing protein n=1 Tax=Streptomyces sp. NPDC006530 TaxID=3364750 RepID=UPI0036B29742
MAKDTVLVLTGYNLQSIPVVQWLSDRFQVLLIASRNATNQLQYPAFLDGVGQATRWRWVDDLFNDYATVEQALSWHEEFGIRHVVCLDEKGLICAAHLRALLNIPSGQQVESALAFRHKDRMYRAASATFPVPEHRVATCAFSVKDAVAELGLPVVVKPTDGAASRDTFVLSTPTDLDDWLRCHPLTLNGPVLVQRFVDADLFHVDGLTSGGAVHAATVSRYSGSTLGYQDARALTSTLVDPDSAEHALLTDSARRVLAALPDTGGSAFHAEFFLSADGEVHLCEIAARAGGGAIVPCHQRATGINLFRAHALLQCGLGEEVLAGARRVTPSGRFGFYLEYAPRGRLLGVPERCEVPGVLEYSVLGRMGQAYDGPTSSVDVLREFVIAVPDDVRAADTYRAIAEWCAHTRTLAPGPA